MGIIAGYGARTDPAQFGYGLSVLIQARLLPGEMKNMIKAVRQTPQIVACDRVSAEDCFVARAGCPRPR
ncbi:MAG: Lrp/AsnC family transcriptional regulator [Pseudomonadota bacterium]